jgi:large subunit ribosomal protein L29
VKLAELKLKSEKELSAMILQFKKEQMNLRFQKSFGTLANVSRIRHVRKTIAKIKTLINNVHLLKNGDK